MEDSAYRDAPLSCPSCPEQLRPVQVQESTVDLCDHCGGVWFDWYDGDTPSLAREVDALERLPEGRPAGGQLACPRCSVDLVDESFQGKGPPVLRCASCQGVFVPRSAIALVAALADVPDEGERDASFWGRLMAFFRRISGLAGGVGGERAARPRAPRFFVLRGGRGGGTSEGCAPSRSAAGVRGGTLSVPPEGPLHPVPPLPKEHGVDGRAPRCGDGLNALRDPPLRGGTLLRALDAAEGEGSGEGAGAGATRRVVARPHPLALRAAGSGAALTGRGAARASSTLR